MLSIGSEAFAMRDMTGDLIGLVPPPEEPEPAGGSLPESVVLPEIGRAHV